MEKFPEKIKDNLETKFEQEFQKREFIDVQDKKVEVLDIKPEVSKYQTPVMLLAGYSDNSPEQRKGNIFTMFKEGRRVLVVKNSHGSEHGLPKEIAQDFAPSILKQVEDNFSVLEAKHLDKVSLLGESRGGISAILMAYLHPEKVENIILSDPGGMVDSISAARLTLRFIVAGIGEGKDFKKRMSEGEVSVAAKEQANMGTQSFAKWVLEDPKASTQEIVDIAKSEIHQLLAAIKEKGIGISVFHGVDDKVFPMADVQKNISAEIQKAKDASLEETPLPYEKIIDGFYSVAGGHGGLNLNPEVYTRAAMKALVSLEEKEKAKAHEKLD